MPADAPSDRVNWVFLSYSWDSPEHKAWVLGLANRLRDDGIDAILDQTHLALGAQTTKFMEECVRDSRKVLVICTDKYKQRFDNRRGGVGYEGNIITAELLSANETTKFITILRDGDWTTAMPTALGCRFSTDLRTDDHEQYQLLLRHLHGVPLQPRPLGARPAWLDEPSTRPAVIIPVPVIVSPQQYMDERRKLPDSALVTAIHKRPHWVIWARPEHFKPARFRTTDDCARFVANANVRSVARWSQYPWFNANLEYGPNFIANDIDLQDGSITHAERWVLFQSAQFLHNLGLDAMPLLGDKTHVLEIMNTTTAVYEFIARMAEQKIVTDRLALTFELDGVAGRQLTWPQDSLGLADRINASMWCQEARITIEQLHTPDELVNGRRDLALTTAMTIYERFGWTDAQTDTLATEQLRRFGQPAPA